MKFGALSMAIVAGAARCMWPSGPAVAQTTTPVDPLFANLTIPAKAATQGMWSALKGWPLVGLHSTLMPTGQVITYGTPLNTGVQDGRTFDIWDPSKGLDDPAAHYTLPNAQAVDSFCSSATLMSTGAMLISGGNSPASGDSPMASTIFTPASATPVALASALAYPRWYASMITLADGRAMIVGGGKPYVTNAYNDVSGSLSRGDVSMTPEIYTAAAGWTKLYGAISEDAFGPDYNRWWYPRQWVAPNGKVFGLSVEKMWMLDPAGAGGIATVGTFKSGYSETTLPNVGPTSTAVMYDVGKILQVGGNGPANGAPTTSSAAATTFNLNGAAVAVAETARMTYARQWGNSVVLPTGKVVVTGGSTYADNAGVNAVYPAEIWDPASGAWTVGASAAVYRGYHSATILLPNGTILSTGGGVPGPATNVNAEIYYPPYLFTTTAAGASALAARPIIASVSGRSFGYGAHMTMSLSSTDQIRSVSVIGLSSTTHSFNTGQRFIPAVFQQTGQAVSLALPGGAAIAPPGYHMVFVVNQAGVPSQGTIIALGGANAPVAGPTGIGQQWATIGITSKRVVHGADGTTMVVSTDGSLWLYAGDNSWINLPAPAAMTDAAIVKRNSIYAQDGNGAVYRYNGASWTQVGVRSKALGASADGTVVVTSTNQTIWVKAADDNGAAWAQVAGNALRVAPANANSLWAIGTDNNVYHLAATGGWTQVGVSVSDIAVSNDGYVLVTNSPNKTLWLKSGDNNTPNWTNLANQTAVGVAVAPGGHVVVVGTDGAVYRR